MKGRIAARLAWAATHVAMGILAAVLVAYFLGVGTPGRALMAELAADELTGAASFGTLQLDPIGRALALTDIEVSDADGRPALSVGALEVASESLADRAFRRLTVQQARLHVRVDEQGHVNLAGLFREKERKEPPRPRPLRIEHLAVAETTVALETPDLALEVGPVTFGGSLSKEARGPSGGRAEATIEGFRLTPRSPRVADLLTGLLGAAKDYQAGPLVLRASWGGHSVDIEELSFHSAPVDLLARANVDWAALEGTLNLTLTREGREVGALLARRQGEDWAFSALLNEVTTPGFAGAQVVVPAVELAGLSLNALPAQLTARLNRASLDTLVLDGTTLSGVALSGEVHFESAEPLQSLLTTIQAGGGLHAVAASWKQGNAALLLLVDSVRRGDDEVVAPLRLRVEAKRTRDHKLQAEVELALHPHGSVRGELTVDLRTRNGRLPWVGQLRIDGLETTALLQLLQLPGMLQPMLSGRLEGTLAVAGDDLANPVVQVRFCRFDLRRKEGGDMVFLTPDDQQKWDFSAEPSFSFFTKELKFGDGKLLMQVKPQG